MKFHREKSIFESYANNLLQAMIVLPILRLPILNCMLTIFTYNSGSR